MATYDIIVFGATSFVGQILSRYLMERHGVDGKGPEKLTWAIAGRSPEKLSSVLRDLGTDSTQLAVIEVDAHDAAGVAAMVGQAKVIVSTVGPYALHGSVLVEECAKAGVDYCDLAGEPQWLRKMIDAHQGTAESSGARIVPSSGYDSIPSDLGVQFLQEQAIEAFGEHCTRVRMGVKVLRGGASGGTLASMVNAVNEAKNDPAVRKAMASPYSLCPPEDRRGPRQPNVMKPEHDDTFNRWVGPFFMAAINTRVVHRSNAIAGHPYGKDFVYDEVMMTGKGPAGAAAAGALAAGLGAFVGAIAAPGLGGLVAKMLPKPGTGPSEEAQRNGGYVMDFWGETASGKRIVTRVTGDQDPGYGSTGKMLGEVAACLARDVPARKPKAKGGFWTPASMLGSDLRARLIEHAGLTFEVREAN